MAKEKLKISRELQHGAQSGENKLDLYNLNWHTQDYNWWLNAMHGLHHSNNSASEINPHKLTEYCT